MSLSAAGVSLDPVALDQLAEDLGLDLLAQVFDTFVIEMESRMGALRAATTAGDAAAAGKEGHAIKSSAATFGMWELRRLAFDLEQAGRAGDMDRVRAMVPALLELCAAACDLMRVGPPAPWGKGKAG